MSKQIDCNKLWVGNIHRATTKKIYTKRNSQKHYKKQTEILKNVQVTYRKSRKRKQTRVEATNKRKKGRHKSNISIITLKVNQVNTIY